MTALLARIEQPSIEHVPSRLAADSFPAHTYGKAAPVPTDSEPAWCTSHYEPTTGEAFHQHDFGKAWGSGQDQVRVGLIRFDGLDALGAGQVELSYAPDGVEVAGSVSLDDGAACDLAGNVLLAVAAKKRAGTWWPALVLQCAYESVRAFAAAVRNARAGSPRTASSHSRSISSM